MGTRNLTAVFADGEYKIAQYGQWDGHPDGQGVTALEFLRDKSNRDKLRAALARVKFLSKEDIADTYVKAGADPNSDFITAEVARKFRAMLPLADRDHGAKILSLVADGHGVLLKNSIDFAGDSLFCEWAYVVDFDANTFEVYRGFNKEPVDAGERFASAPIEGRSGYYQVKLAKMFHLDDLPTVKQFLKCFEEEDSDAA